MILVSTLGSTSFGHALALTTFHLGSNGPSILLELFETLAEGSWLQFDLVLLFHLLRHFLPLEVFQLRFHFFLVLENQKVLSVPSQQDPSIISQKTYVGGTGADEVVLHLRQTNTETAPARMNAHDAHPLLANVLPAAALVLPLPHHEVGFVAFFHRLGNGTAFALALEEAAGLLGFGLGIRGRDLVLVLAGKAGLAGSLAAAAIGETKS